MKKIALAACLVLAQVGTQAQAADATFATRSLTPETALKAAQAALAKCRADGYQVGVSVVDRSGMPQVFLRDRFAGAHTVDIATNKAWTAASFRIPTTELEKATRASTSMAGIRAHPRVAAIGGGLLIEAGGAAVAAIGVSGAPGGEADEACAAAGIKAIVEDLEF